MNYQACKHVISNTGLHCENNGISQDEQRHGFCKKHYEMRKDSISFTNGICYNMFRGKQKFCTNTGVPDLLGLCQDCYDKAKEKRKVEIERLREQRRVEREQWFPFQESYDTILADILHRCRTRQLFDIITEILQLYLWSQYEHLTSQQRSTMTQEIIRVYEATFNVTPVQEDIEQLLHWADDEDRRIFHPQPRVRFTLKYKHKPTQLERIANDTQNVHTKEVVEQSNKIIDKLLTLSATKPTLDRVPELLGSKWLLRPWGSWKHSKPVIEDMLVWYNTSLCKTQDDWLYKKVLNGLYIYTANIKDDETRREVRYRIFQECKDAVGMCCEGHISRLANALVGFDEEAVPQVSTGETIQQQMSAIANMDITVEEKYIKAKLVLSELKVPELKQKEWLDAF